MAHKIDASTVKPASPYEIYRDDNSARAQLEALQQLFPDERQRQEFVSIASTFQEFTETHKRLNDLIDEQLGKEFEQLTQNQLMQLRLTAIERRNARWSQLRLFDFLIENEESLKQAEEESAMAKPEIEVADQGKTVEDVYAEFGFLKKVANPQNSSENESPLGAQQEERKDQLVDAPANDDD